MEAAKALVYWKSLFAHEGMASALEELKSFGIHLLKPAAHKDLVSLSFWSTFVYLLRKAFNPFKTAWSFSEGELAFVYSVLETVLGTLDSSGQPAQELLIQLRTGLYDCQWIIGNRLSGLPELRKATYLEHFCQAPQVKTVTLEEMGISFPPPLKQARAI